ncbi:hypothetical protein [Bartonella sp. DGB1]|uniref:hypothetical protein n=1 Tax=Bartonella sp. DGB1 TaxID=3239807 RepID=UPI0035234D76
MIHPEDFIKTRIPIKDKIILMQCVNEGHKVIRNMRKDDLALGLPMVNNMKCYFLSIGVHFVIQRNIESGILPFTCGWKNFAKPTGKYLEIIGHGFTFSINSVANCNKPPKKAIFREQKLVGNKTLFNYQENCFADIIYEPYPHFILTFSSSGYSLNDLRIGLPANYKRSQWEWVSNNWLHEPHLVTGTSAEIENTSYNPEDMNLLKETLKSSVINHEK